MPNVAPADLEVRPLEPVDAADLERFECGDADLDEFIRADATRLSAEHIVQTYLARRASSGRRVLGYVAVLSDAVRLETRERKKLRLASSDHPIVPALKIARLAVANDFQRHGGIGTALVRFAYVTAAELAEIAVDCSPSTLTRSRLASMKDWASSATAQKSTAIAPIPVCDSTCSPQLRHLGSSVRSLRSPCQSLSATLWCLAETTARASTGTRA